MSGVLVYIDHIDDAVVYFIVLLKAEKVMSLDPSSNEKWVVSHWCRKVVGQSRKLFWDLT